MADPVAIDVSRASPGLWDRVSTWVSENKAVAYTIAGTVVVITSAGAIYYLSGQKSTPSTTSTEKRKSKKERRKEKKAAEEAQKSGISLKDEEAGSSFHFHAVRNPLIDKSPSNYTGGTYCTESCNCRGRVRTTRNQRVNSGQLFARG